MAAPSSAPQISAELEARRGIPDWLAILLGVLLGELHRFLLALLLAATTVTVFSVRPETHGYAWFLAFELIYQWVGLLLIFVAAVKVSRSQGSRCVHWLAAGSLVLDLAVRSLAGEYTTLDPAWYHLAVPMGVVFAWVVTLRLIAR
jgi:hypothetical protein